MWKCAFQTQLCCLVNISVARQTCIIAPPIRAWVDGWVGHSLSEGYFYYCAAADNVTTRVVKCIWMKGHGYQKLYIAFIVQTWLFYTFKFKCFFWSFLREIKMDIKVLNYAHTKMLIAQLRWFGLERIWFDLIWETLAFIIKPCDFWLQTVWVYLVSRAARYIEMTEISWMVILQLSVLKEQCGDFTGM